MNNLSVNQRVYGVFGAGIPTSYGTIINFEERPANKFFPAEMLAIIKWDDMERIARTEVAKIMEPGQRSANGSPIGIFVLNEIIPIHNNVIQLPVKKLEPEVIKADTWLDNGKCYVELRNDKEVFGRDLTDHYNDPAFYNKTYRGLKKAWEELKDTFSVETTMHDAISILSKHNIRTHSYCMMD